jgi:hypothetical protein
VFQADRLTAIVAGVDNILVVDTALAADDVFGRKWIDANDCAALPAVPVQTIAGSTSLTISR